MGTQRGVSAGIGNVIHYKLGDNLSTRSATRKYEQTKGTRAKASEFGMASTIGKIIRENLESVIFDTTDNKMRTGLVREIFVWSVRQM